MTDPEPLRSSLEGWRGPSIPLSLTEAKRRARATDQLLADGIDPKQVRNEKRRVSSIYDDLES